ncbi:antibiotic biosynthesis monooxygenase [Micromonospora sp. NPDC050276]|uniref:antibiotic biosynthesis monooxygenase n=1 Tax=Micromonospora sp. NPDC050276 TaxID=3364278 RepID=UPI0037BDD124
MDGFEAAYERAAVALRAAPQCMDYELSRCLDDPACYLLRITWTSVDEHLKGFRGGPVFGQFFAAIKPYVEDIQEMRHYARTSVAGPGGAAPPSLYQWAGGTDAFMRLCDAFYRLVRSDDLLAPMFAHMHPDHARYAVP